MARSTEVLLGWLRGERFDGTKSSIRVSKSGRSFWIDDDSKRHLCHPSIRNVEDTKKEAVMVFSFVTPHFESA